MAFAKKFYSILQQYFSIISIDFFKFLFAEFYFNSFNNRFYSKNLNNPKEEILFDNFESLNSISYRYVFLKAISNKFNLKLKYFNLGYNFLYFIIYCSFGASNISTLLFKIKNFSKIKSIYNKEILKIKSKKDLFKFKYKNINIGWDIYESYLRRFNQPTVKLNDNNFHKLFKEALTLYLFWENYLKKKKVKYIFISHRMYIETNILNRLAIKNRITVLTIGDGGSMMKFKTEKLSINRYYRKLFNKLDKIEKQKAKKIGKKRILLRLSGKKSADMNYSTKSAFSKKKKSFSHKFSKHKLNILICTHDFYDNPHGYGKNLFLDFYDWLIFLSKISHKTNYNWYIKPHPDYTPGTIETILEINKKFKNINFINPNTKFNDISENIDFALTCHGTIGHELPFLGITVINANINNPHCSYNFNYTPKNLKSYKNKLLNLSKKDKIKVNKSDIYKFYYMHYFYLKTNLFKNLRVNENKIKSISFLRYTQKMYQNLELESDIKKINEFLLNKNSRYFDDKKKEIIFSKICNF